MMGKSLPGRKSECNILASENHYAKAQKCDREFSGNSINNLKIYHVHGRRNKKEGGNTGLTQTSKGHIQARDFTVQVRRCQRRVLSRVVTL